MGAGAGLVALLFALAALYLSVLIDRRQDTLSKASRYDLSWTAAQTTVELARFGQVIAAFAVHEGLASAEDARRLLYLRPEDGITMNPDRLIHDAKAVVMALAATGYRPPAPSDLPVFGKPLAAEMELGAYLMKKSGHITDHEALIAGKLANVLCGGDVTRQSTAPEQYFLDLEREAFKSLCGEQKTLARMEHLLKKGKVLRN